MFIIFTDKDKDDEKKGYSKLVAFLISLLAGILGADWFYLSAGDGGYIVAGVFKLLTLGGFGTRIIYIACYNFLSGNTESALIVRIISIHQ